MKNNFECSKGATSQSSSLPSSAEWSIVGDVAQRTSPGSTHWRGGCTQVIDVFIISIEISHA